MKWTKRTAALLMTLLLLGTIAQARDVAKAAPGSRSTTAIIRADEEKDEKMPVLPVLPEAPVQEEPPVMTVDLQTEKTDLSATERRQAERPAAQEGRRTGRFSW